jgi:hypothetical protein
MALRARKQDAVVAAPELAAQHAGASRRVRGARWFPAWILAGQLASLSASGCERKVALDLEGRAAAPLEAHAAATVLVFLSPECPIANRYAPEIRRLEERFAARGARFYLVYPRAEDTPDVVRAHLAEYGFTLPALRDPRHALVDAAHATITPEAAVFTRAGVLAYHGRIDDRFAGFGLDRTAPTRADLADAIDAVLDGRAVTSADTAAIGCAIPPSR